MAQTTTFLKHAASLSRLEGIDAYSETGAARKDTLHRTGKTWLRNLATQLGLSPGEYDVRSNRGGIAVSGEVSLHSDHLYVELSESCLHRGVTVMYRTCAGRKDDVGGQNHFARMLDLTDSGRLERFVDACTRMARPA